MAVIDASHPSAPDLSPETHRYSESLEDDMHVFAIATNAVNAVNAINAGLTCSLTYVHVMDKLCYLGGTR